MLTPNYISNLIKASSFREEDASTLKEIIEKYPYFQPARALYLKLLQTKESYKFNQEIKRTAAYTVDRSVLFDLITATDFSAQTKDKEVAAKKPLKERLLKGSQPAVKKAIEELGIDQPLRFTQNDSFSFNQWLELTQSKPIQRKPVVEVPKEKSEQEKIIDRFIETSPKISRPSKHNTGDFKVAENKQNNQLATETLAKVYLAQKKYDSAIQAYKILSLKYPEKSGFFADQVKKIKILQNNK